MPKRGQDSRAVDSASDTWGFQRPVFALPPLQGDEVARPGLMDDLVAAVIRPGLVRWE
jgi:hypothetical protein